MNYVLSTALFIKIKCFAKCAFAHLIFITEKKNLGGEVVGTGYMLLFLECLRTLHTFYYLVIIRVLQNKSYYPHFINDKNKVQDD